MEMFPKSTRVLASAGALCMLQIALASTPSTQAIGALEPSAPTTGTSAKRSTVNYPDTMGTVAIVTAYSCPQIIDMMRHHFDRYDSLDPNDRVIASAKYNACNPPSSGRSGQFVVVESPAPTSNEKVFYGTISPGDLNKVTNACKKGGKVAGVAIQVVGYVYDIDYSGMLGQAVYSYSDVSCDGIAKAYRGNNIFAIMDPGTIGASAAGSATLSDILNRIPVLGDQDRKKILKAFNDAAGLPAIVVHDRKITIGGNGKPEVTVPLPPLPPGTVIPSWAKKLVPPGIR